MPCFAFKDFFCRFLQMLALHPRTYAFGSGPKCSSKCFALHPKYSQHKAWNPKCLGKSWTGGLFLHPKSLNKRVDSYPKWWNKWVAFANAFLHIQIVWTKPVVHPKRSNKCLCFVSKIFEAIPCFSSKVFEQMPWFASKMWANNFLRIQNVWTGAFSCTQHVWTKALLYNQHVRTNVLIRTSMFEQIPCFCFFFFNNPSFASKLLEQSLAVHSNRLHQMLLIRIQDVWMNSLLFIQSVWTKCVDSHPKCLKKVPWFESTMLSKALMYIRNVWTYSFDSHPRNAVLWKFCTKCLWFVSNMFEEMPFFASKVFGQNALLTKSSEHKKMT